MPGIKPTRKGEGANYLPTYKKMLHNLVIKFSDTEVIELTDVWKNASRRLP